MRKLILKYNARIGTDKLPKIQELVKKHDLKIDAVDDLRENTKWFKVVQVSGKADKLADLDQDLVRHASITKKAA